MAVMAVKVWQRPEVLENQMTWRRVSEDQWRMQQTKKQQQLLPSSLLLAPRFNIIPYIFGPNLLHRIKKTNNYTLWENVRKNHTNKQINYEKTTKLKQNHTSSLFSSSNSSPLPPRLCWTSVASTGGVSTGGWSDRKRRSATCICCHRSSTSSGGLVAELCHHHHHHHHHHLFVKIKHPSRRDSD